MEEPSKKKKNVPEERSEKMLRRARKGRKKCGEKQKEKKTWSSIKGWADVACGQRASSRPNKTEKVGRWKCDQTIGLTLSACTDSARPASVESWVFQRRRKCRIYLFARLFPRVRCRVRIGTISENCQSIRSTYLIARRENDATFPQTGQLLRRYRGPVESGRFRKIASWHTFVCIRQFNMQ